jgi:iron(II)-dependent oxidoreductase
MKLCIQSKTGVISAIVLAVWAGYLAHSPEVRSEPSKGAGKFAGMVLIPAGPFTMGRDGGPTEESPAHRVSLPAFRIDKKLVTAADYAKFIQVKGPVGPAGEMYLDVHDPDALVHQRNGAWLPDKGFENYPAGEMSWHGAVAFCKWLGKRLPSEAEWEKAARGTDGRLYPWGNEIPSSDLAFFGGFRGETVPVGRFPKGVSPYGVRDMAGQVWEWTTSIARPYPYDPKDGRENLSAFETRVARGGSSSSDAEGLTVTSREMVSPWRATSGHAYYGFRCAASVEMFM